MTRGKLSTKRFIIILKENYLEMVDMNLIESFYGGKHGLADMDSIISQMRVISDLDLKRFCSYLQNSIIIIYCN